MLRRFLPLCIGLAATLGTPTGPLSAFAAPRVRRDRSAFAPVGLVRSGATQGRSVPPNWTERTKPFRVMANIYYVGTVDLSSFLVTSSDGHVLIDTGVEENARRVLDNIRALGFTVKDIRVMLTTQAHFDHVGAHTPEEGNGSQSARVSRRRGPRRRRRRGRLPLRTRVSLPTDEGGRHRQRRRGRPSRADRPHRALDAGSHEGHDDLDDDGERLRRTGAQRRVPRQHGGECGNEALEEREVSRRSKRTTGARSK